MKKISLLPIAFIALLALSACSPKPVSTPVPVPEKPVQNNVHSTLPSTVTVTAGDQKPCTKEYLPVCGKIQVQCIKAPCPPIATTFSNKCEAENAKATDIATGACVDKTINDVGMSPETGCTTNGGTWSAGASECEGIGKEVCEKIGGTFNECASACRNNPKAEICTMQCVLVCQF